MQEPDETTEAAHPADGGSLTRAVALGVMAGSFGAAALAGLAAFDLVIGLVVVAYFVGRMVGFAVRSGSGTAVDPATRVGTAVGLAAIAIGVGQVAIWLLARSGGGTLGIVDYLVATYGPVAPLELLLAAGAAWWTAR